jgi:hypothetical protein
MGVFDLEFCVLSIKYAKFRKSHMSSSSCRIGTHLLHKTHSLYFLPLGRSQNGSTFLYLKTSITPIQAFRTQQVPTRWVLGTFHGDEDFHLFQAFLLWCAQGQTHLCLIISILSLGSIHSFRTSAHGATQKKLIGHANYQPVTSELLPL